MNDRTQTDELDRLLRAATAADASDIHLIAGQPPMIRIHTQMQAIGGEPTLTADKLEAIFHAMASAEHREKFAQVKDVDFSYALVDGGRFRVNVHRHRHGLGIALRAIKDDIPPLESLNLPEVIGELTYLPRGLVLVTGATGSGKSTTLAAMIQSMNLRDAKHIITLEDPIEYAFVSASSVIEQRELGSDVPTFASGLRHALRQDPDIILVGEMRDLETTSAALTAAETGHLVLSTLHTNSAAATVERIIDMYPAMQQNQIRAMLANTLSAVVSQQLFRRADQPGMVPALEIMLATPAVRNLVREDRTFELPNVIETSRELGMQTLDHAIARLFFNQMITQDQALEKANNPKQVQQLLAA